MRRDSGVVAPRDQADVPVVHSSRQFEVSLWAIYALQRPPVFGVAKPVVVDLLEFGFTILIMLVLVWREA